MTPSSEEQKPPLIYKLIFPWLFYLSFKHFSPLLIFSHLLYLLRVTMHPLSCYFWNNYFLLFLKTLNLILFSYHTLLFTLVLFPSTWPSFNSQLLNCKDLWWTGGKLLLFFQTQVEFHAATSICPGAEKHWTKLFMWFN